MRRGKQRWGIFVHDPDGDMGYGTIVGPFQSPKAADDKAESIRNAGLRRGREVECVVVPVTPGAASGGGVIEEVFPS